MSCCFARIKSYFTLLSSTALEALSVFCLLLPLCDIPPKIFRFFKNLANFYLETKLPSQGHSSVGSGKTMSPESTRRRPETAKVGNVPRDLIDDHLFIEALALSAFEVVYRDP